MRLKPLRSLPARLGTPLLLAAALSVSLATPPAQAALQDEIQVYDDSINDPGEFGLELHVNTTPRGIATPSYPGEKVSLHGWRLTPEFSWGLTRTVELGLYVPTVLDAQGQYQLAGIKGRVKWLPIRPEGDDGIGWFTGFNVELSQSRAEYDPARLSTESKWILGHRSLNGFIGFNLNIGNEIEGPNSGDRPEVEYAFKGMRELGSGWSAGAEYYLGTGAVGHTLPADQQDRRVFLIAELDRKPWEFHFGIGSGLTSATDNLTVKFIAEIPMNLLH